MSLPTLRASPSGPVLSIADLLGCVPVFSQSDLPAPDANGVIQLADLTEYCPRGAVQLNPGISLRYGSRTRIAGRLGIDEIVGNTSGAFLVGRNNSLQGSIDGVVLRNLHPNGAYFDLNGIEAFDVNGCGFRGSPGQRLGIIANSLSFSVRSSTIIGVGDGMEVPAGSTVGDFFFTDLQVITPPGTPFAALRILAPNNFNTLAASDSIFNFASPASQIPFDIDTAVTFRRLIAAITPFPFGVPLITPPGKVGPSDPRVNIQLNPGGIASAIAADLGYSIAPAGAPISLTLPGGNAFTPVTPGAPWAAPSAAPPERFVANPDGTLTYVGLDPTRVSISGRLAGSSGAGTFTAGLNVATSPPQDPSLPLLPLTPIAGIEGSNRVESGFFSSGQILSSIGGLLLEPANPATGLTGTRIGLVARRLDAAGGAIYLAVSANLSVVAIC